MNSPMLKLLTIVTETTLEKVLIDEIERLGARGYTITDARGKGGRGARSAFWQESSNIRVEVVCDAGTANKIADYLQAHYYENYAMIIFISEISVLRPEKF